MRFLQLAVYYFRWHYGRALIDIWRIYTNILWLIFNYFSIGILFRTLFAPWRRLKEEGQGKSRVGSFFENLTITTLMRIVGFLIRSVTICVGLFVLFLAAFWGLFIYPIWFFLPFIIIAIALFGIISFFK